jgi:hypothetical protein
MAVTSGSCSTNAPYASRHLVFSWQLVSQSVADNTSTISWSVKGAGGNSRKYYESSDFDFVVNNQTVYYKDPYPRVKVYIGTVVKSGTLVIKHDENGEKTFSASIKASIYYSRQTASGSGSWTLPKIDRIATITDAPNFTDEENPTISYVVPEVDVITNVQACISLTGSQDDIIYRDISMTDTSYTFNLTESERNVLRYATTDSVSRTVKFFVRTFIGEDKYTNSVLRTLTIANCAPTISVATAVDTQDWTLALTGNENTIIKYENIIVANMSSVLHKGASMVSQSITNGTNVVNGNVGETNMTATFNDTSSAVFVYEVTDSRGLTTTHTITKTLIDYNSPTCSLSITPLDANQMTTMTISGASFNGNFGNSTNDIHCYYRVKQADEEYGPWVEVGNLNLSGNTYSAICSLGGFVIGVPYSFEAKIEDSVATRYSSVETFEHLEAIQFMKGDENVYPLCYFPIGAIIMLNSDVSPASIYGGEWERIKDRFLIGAGSSYAIGNMGGEATHKLVAAEMPQHSHTASTGWGASTSGSRMQSKRGGSGSGNTFYTESTGGNKAHENMPPYRAVCTWQRIA